MSFTFSVQRDDVKSPIRKGFQLPIWHKKATELSVDDRDSNLVDAGVWVFEQSNLVRQNLKVATDISISTNAKLRAFIGIANYNLAALSARNAQLMDQMADKRNGVLIATEIVSSKFEMSGGGSFNLEEVIQALVDAIQLPIREALTFDPPLAGSPNFKNINTKDLIFDTNLGVLYNYIEMIWNDCLWNDYRISINNNIHAFSPNNESWIKWLVGSEFRHKYLSIQKILLTKAKYDQLANIFRTKILNFQLVEKIVENGKKQRIQLTKEDDSFQKCAYFATFKDHAFEEYYNELANEELEKIPGANLDLIINCWAIISSATDFLEEKITKKFYNKNYLQDTAFYSNWVGCIHISALTIAISTSLKIDKSLAGKLISFLTYKGEKLQEIWTQPLVQISPDKVAPIFAASQSPNLRRIVDIWMKQLGIDLSRRGIAFEKYIRKNLSTSIKKSHYLSNAVVLPNSFKLKQKKITDEEIDLVIIINNLIFLGEIKCIVQPTEPKEFALHRDTVFKAIQQIKRKAKTVKENSNVFLEQLRMHNVHLDENYEILPMVILNSAIHAGITIDDIPIVDIEILQTFFDGKYTDTAKLGKDGKLQEVTDVAIYSSNDEALNIARAYFRNPPQVAYVWESIEYRELPIPR